MIKLVCRNLHLLCSHSLQPPWHSVVMQPGFTKEDPPPPFSCVVSHALTFVVGSTCLSLENEIWSNWAAQETRACYWCVEISQSKLPSTIHTVVLNPRSTRMTIQKSFEGTLGPTGQIFSSSVKEGKTPSKARDEPFENTQSKRIFRRRISLAKPLCCKLMCLYL